MFVVELCLLSSSAMNFKMKVNIRNRRLRLGLVYGAKRHFQQYFSYIEAVSFIDGGNWSTRSKPPACRKSLANFIT
jgi:hypothetical protein